MKCGVLLVSLSIGLPYFVAGCAKETKNAELGTAQQKGETSVPEDSEVSAERAKLSPEARRLVEAQDFCAVMESSRLGSMGVPVKVMIKDQPVFLCCKGCRKRALHDPDKTLAKVAELKAKNRIATPGS